MADEPLALPHDLAAERAVLGAVLLDRQQLDRVLQVLTAEDFFDARHRKVFEAVCHLDRENESVDAITVRSRLDRTGSLAAAGGAGYLAELYDALALSTNAAEYAAIIRGHALSRRLYRYGAGITREVAAREPRALLEDAERQLFQIAERSQSAAPVPIGEATDPVAAEADRLREDFGGIRSGLDSLDSLMGGLRRSDLILLGARPGEGKTSLALNITLAAALQGKRVLVFSLEMPVKQIAIRLLFSHARVDARQLSLPGMLSQADRQRIQNANRQVREMPIRVDDSTVTPIEIRSKSRQQRRDPGLDLIVVDYLQLMHADDDHRRRFENRNLEIADISRSLKLLAKELDVPVLALSQLSRAPEQRDFAEPRLSDLRESGALEQDADIVLFIHRERRKPARGEGEDAPAAPPQEVRRVLVAKNRNGPTGVVRLAWLDRFTRFETIDESAFPAEAGEPGEYAPETEMPADPGGDPGF